MTKVGQCVTGNTREAGRINYNCGYIHAKSAAMCSTRNRADYEVREMPPSDSGPYAGERPRVLIAEDDTVTRLILKHWIKRWGYDIVVVDNGAGSLGNHAARATARAGDYGLGDAGDGWHRALQKASRQIARVLSLHFDDHRQD